MQIANSGNAKLWLFINWKPVAFNFPRFAKSDSRDVQFSFHEHMGMYICVGLIPNMRICVLLTIPADTFKKRSVLFYQKVGKVNLRERPWGSEFLGIQWISRIRRIPPPEGYRESRMQVIIEITWTVIPGILPGRVDQHLF